MVSTAASASSVSKRYGSGENTVHALRDVSINIAAGQLTAIMGPSGSGKSTLMHLLAGLDSASDGRILVGNTDITRMNDAELTLLRRRRIGFIFQAFNLVPSLSVWDNITLPAALDGRRLSRAEMAHLEELVRSLGIWEQRLRAPHEVSGGQQQRVAIARALGMSPELIFADEPTGNLDSRSGREVLRLLRSACDDHGATVAMVTHDPGAASIADRIVFIADGRIVDDVPGASAEDIAQRMISIEAAR